jgi:uncharacterized protein YvpB
MIQYNNDKRTKKIEHVYLLPESYSGYNGHHWEWDYNEREMSKEMTKINTAAGQQLGKRCAGNI